MQQIAPPRPPPPIHWSREFIKPVNLVSLGLAIAAIAFGIYTWRSGLVRPEISWSVENQIVVDSQRSIYTPNRRSITVLDLDKHEITQNVYADQFTIWNSGNVALDDVDRSTRVRDPLNLVAKGNARIVDVSITARKNEAEGFWQVLYNPSSAIMKWVHFDTNSAVQILVLYAGDKDSSIEPTITLADGSLVEAATPNKSATPQFIAVCVLALSILILIEIALRFWHKISDREIPRPWRANARGFQFGLSLGWLISCWSYVSENIIFKIPGF